MSDNLPPFTLRRRGVRFDAWYHQWVHPVMLDDKPVVESMKRWTVEELILAPDTTPDWTGPRVIDPDRVTVEVLTTADLAETIDWLMEQQVADLGFGRPANPPWAAVIAWHAVPEPPAPVEVPETRFYGDDAPGEA